MEKVKFSSNRLFRFLSNKYIKGTLLVIAGMLLGLILFNHPTENDRTDQNKVLQPSEARITLWTCAMHPQIRMDKPGQCLICGMDLIPLQKSEIEIDDQAIVISESAMKLAEIQTSVVGEESASKELLLYGKILPDEKLLHSQTAHIPGRIEKLRVNFTGEMVKKGQMIAQIYSPELINAQKELIEAMAISDKYPEVLTAAREKLRNWKLSDKQISDIETSDTISSVFEIYSNTTGIVSSLKVSEGDYISKGAVLYDVVDISEVWAVFDAYESDLPWVALGQKVEFTTQAVPGKVFNGKISFIDPVIDPVTRTARIRMEIKNTALQLKPDLFVNGIVKSDKMNNSRYLIVPQSAVLWTGPRSIVYVKISDGESPAFKMREITLGAAMKDFYIVLNGLKAGEEIVTNGTFSVDAAAQLSGKPSMMGRDVIKTSDIKPEEMSEMPMDISVNMNSNVKQSLEKLTFNVSGNCEMCKDRIEKAALSVLGVKSAVWDMKLKKVEIEYNTNKIKAEDVHRAIALAGHDTELFKADDNTYKALPACCLYRK